MATDPTPKSYSVLFDEAARKALKKLQRADQQRISDRIDALAHDPRPPGVEALQGSEKGYLRLRIGDFRVVYSVEDNRLIVLVVRIGNRRDVYR